MRADLPNLATSGTSSGRAAPPNTQFTHSSQKRFRTAVLRVKSCKVHYPNTGIEQPDDRDYERGSRYCLSGLCGHVTTRDSGDDTFVPARHGVRDANVDSIVWDGLEDYAIPFHPTCFDIFYRLSRQRFGHVAFEALGDYLFANSDKDEVYRVSHDKNVDRSRDQWWDHISGCEYLAANPLFIPRLAPILKASVQHSPTFNPQASAFEVPDHHGKPDIFNTLTLELRLQVVPYLSSKEFATLRLASRTFRQLPISLWRDLLLQDMPFLSEVWSNEDPYSWTYATYDAVAAHELSDWREETRDIIRTYMSENLPAWVAHVDEILAQREGPGILQVSQAEVMKELVTCLPAAKTDWYHLYTEVTRNWSDLKGLRNRKRIWEDIGAVMPNLDKNVSVR
ncbi:hypothetical protein BU23DRAFT_598904 [Bimuria novae-zelandiae CBS 107.79]|uniref:F-box domain-containing protein n=1 Tax=Bimuria novae-zelandiae CBS 107.79 TaxID=1447943 RepID=A0A6A5VBX1_9PLEO|nr:hypothetical protein BU23DRAFT_598904 [Bimuria novae-zelandiae CBS 107.79]